MFYTVYKTTNKINNKFYIGVHQTNDLNDDYMGSGSILKDAIKNYGIENFEKEILFLLNSPKAMYEKEKEIVTEELVKDKNCYNIKIGGEGLINNKNNMDSSNAVLAGKKSVEIRRKLRNDLVWSIKLKHNLSIAQKIRYSKETQEYKNNITKPMTNYWINNKHSEETKIKMRETAKGKNCGIQNPNYGKCWIYNENFKINKLIYKNDLNNWLSDGWIVGRKLKI